MSKTKFFNTVASGEKVTILLYGDVGSYDKVDSGRVVSELLQLQAQYKNIDVRINSVGGDVFNGIAIYNALRTSTASITIYIDGVAASIAGIIALCGKPLYMSPYAKLMLHAVSGGTYGSASALRKTADTIEALQKDLASMIAGRCGMSAEEVASRYFDDTDHWIDAEEALSLGLIDGIYDMDDKPETGTTEDIYHYFNNRLEIQSQKDKDMALIDDIKKIPTFSDKADESAIVAHIRELTNKATKADSLEQANKTYKEKVAALEAKEIEAFVDKAVAEGKIGKEQKAVYVKLMNSDREAVEELLGGMKAQPKMRAADFINESGQPASFDNKSWDELDKAGRLAELREQNPALFKSKYKEKFGVDYVE